MTMMSPDCLPTPLLPLSLTVSSLLLAKGHQPRTRLCWNIDILFSSFAFSNLERSQAFADLAARGKLLRFISREPGKRCPKQLWESAYKLWRAFHVPPGLTHSLIGHSVSIAMKVTHARYWEHIYDQDRHGDIKELTM